MDSRNIIKALKRDGWLEVKQVGSHRQFKHPTKKGPRDNSASEKDMLIGTLKSIAKQAQIKLRWPGRTG
jgi:predicted RNA binding protein YcfA (HicA-like mRNA interferase family)